MRFLILNQAFFPDVVATAQHAADLARALVAEGNEVHVVCSQRAYDSPSVKFSSEDNWDGVSIHRIPVTGLGKASKWRRAADFGSFLVSCLARLVTLGRFDCVIALTSPPLISFVGMAFARRTGARLVLWLMDINPDEAVAAGWLRSDSLTGRAMQTCLRMSLRGAARIVVLDRFMRDRITAKGIPAEKVFVIPPWTHDDAVRQDPEGRRTFRHMHHLAEKFVVMYSGNHSPCHPLDSLLEAAWQLRGESDIAFCFIGGGSEFTKVQKFADARNLANISCLPYQPLREISASLSAADLQVVVMGDPFVGIVHPCKIYNILRLGIPILYIGAVPSHATEILPSSAWNKWAWTARHGKPEELARAILAAAAHGHHRTIPEAISLAKQFSQKTLVPKFVNLLTGNDQAAAGTTTAIRPDYAR